MNEAFTHILCEPYENEEYLNREEINIENFTEKTNDLIQSLKNITIDNLDEYRSLDDYLKIEALSINIPKSFNASELKNVYKFSNTNEINKFIYTLKSNMDSVFDLKGTDSIERIKNKLESIQKFNESLKTHKSENNIKNFGTTSDLIGNFDSIFNVDDSTKSHNDENNIRNFDTFSDLIGNFDSIFSILDDSMYNNLIEWICSFPSFLLDIKLDIETNTSGIVTKNVNTITKRDKISPEELNIIKKEIIYKVFEIYRIIVKNIADTKKFWIEFLDMIDPENEVEEFDCNEETDMNLILQDLDKIINSDDEDEDDEYAYGSEAGPKTDSKIKRGGALKEAGDTIASFFTELPGKVNRIRKQFKLFRMRAKNHAFYMKYMGRIDGLYERYADEAPIIENGMKGDPVEILKESGHEYISNVSNGLVEIQHNLIDISKEFANTGNPKEMLNKLKKYGGMYMNDVQKASKLKKAFYKSIRFKIGELILTDNKIYGYTSQSIAENEKMPPSNHAIVSLFVDRPDEKPFEQKVSDIFKSTDSFKLIAKNEKEPVFEATVICSDVLTKGIQKETFNQLKINKKNSKEKFEQELRELTTKASDPKKERKKLKAQFVNCWKALENAFNYMLKAKNYVLDLIQSYFVMMTRIDNLCKVCVVSMLKVETMKTDDRYNKGFKADNIESHRNYTQYDDETETKGERQMKKIEERRNKNEQRSERKQAMYDRMQRIKKAMRHGDPFKF